MSAAPSSTKQVSFCVELPIANPAEQASTESADFAHGFSRKIDVTKGPERLGVRIRLSEDDVVSEIECKKIKVFVGVLPASEDRKGGMKLTVDWELVGRDSFPARHFFWLLQAYKDYLTGIKTRLIELKAKYDAGQGDPTELGLAEIEAVRQDLYELLNPACDIRIPHQVRLDLGVQIEGVPGHYNQDTIIRVFQMHPDIDTQTLAMKDHGLTQSIQHTYDVECVKLMSITGLSLRAMFQFCMMTVDRAAKSGVHTISCIDAILAAQGMKV